VKFSFKLANISRSSEENKTVFSVDSVEKAGQCLVPVVVDDDVVFCRRCRPCGETDVSDAPL